MTRSFAGESTGDSLRQRWIRRLDTLGEDPFGDPDRPSEARIELVTYPEAVVLTGLFASAYRRDHPQLPIEAAQRLDIAPHQLPLREMGEPLADEGISQST
ncbi:hypothetical protein [Streptomyces sp. NPDC059928]|uniref:hypothetical protein n=1 Tax=unclassified Streptomyces TaxID=2593676 RepID=UPI003659FA8A